MLIFKIDLKRVVDEKSQKQQKAHKYVYEIKLMMDQLLKFLTFYIDYVLFVLLRRDTAHKKSGAVA